MPIRFTSLKQLPLADATVLHYSSPVFPALFAALTLGETMRPAEVVLATRACRVVLAGLAAI